MFLTNSQTVVTTGFRIVSQISWILDTTFSMVSWMMGQYSSNFSFSQLITSATAGKTFSTRMSVTLVMVSLISGICSITQSRSCWMMGITVTPSSVATAPNDCLTSLIVSPNLTPAATESSDMTSPRSFARSMSPPNSSPDVAKIGLSLYARLSPKSSAAAADLSSSVPSAMICAMASSMLRSVPSNFLAACSMVDISTPHCPAAYCSSWKYVVETPIRREPLSTASAVSAALLAMPTRAVPAPTAAAPMATAALPTALPALAMVVPRPWAFSSVFWRDFCASSVSTNTLPTSLKISTYTSLPPCSSSSSAMISAAGRVSTLLPRRSSR